ncbi:MAG: phosphoribosylglycinamide formyltransferase [Gammaproteobacteria bacterium]|nr:phosphoribosylglycinamide formyltransferase [Gammaproteobacteria bacterium]
MLISGTGTNLKALIDSAASGELPARIAAVFSDRGDAPGLRRAREAGIEAHHVEPQSFADRDAYESALADAIEAAADGPPAAVVLAGFMRILRGEVLRRFAGRLLNIHPSLLPKYRGLDTHARALAAGEEGHGATVHFVTEELDAGPRIIQFRVAVRPDDTAQTLAARVLRGEHRILPQAVGWLATGRLRLEGGEVMLDGRRLDAPVVVEDR